ncbi:MAG: N-acetylneuraminate synthase family protein [Arenicella sp.]
MSDLNHVSIIAEVGSVHDGSFGNALKLADLAKNLGADAVKYQTHLSEHETLADAPSPGYFSDESRFDYFIRTGFSLAQWKQIKAHCDDIGIEFISSPFSEMAVQWLDEIGVSRFKIPSGEVTNIPMLEAINKLSRPVILSSGMSNWAELDQAVAALSDVDLTLMQCTSQYPCPPENVGLNVITEMQTRYHKPVGYSDHTQTNYAALAAVSVGASCIEKHLTFSNAMYGSDAPLASEPEAFADMVKGVRAISIIQNNTVDKDDLSAYQEMKNIFQKSVVAAQEIAKGTCLNASMFAYKKPGSGISAANYANLIGKTTKQTIAKDALIQFSHLVD